MQSIMAWGKSNTMSSWIQALIEPLVLMLTIQKWFVFFCVHDIPVQIATRSAPALMFSRLAKVMIIYQFKNCILYLHLGSYGQPLGKLHTKEKNTETFIIKKYVLLYIYSPETSH